MAAPLLDAVFLEISRATLEADPAVCFVLDDKLRLMYCNPAWDRFAVQNGAPYLCAGRILGMPVLDSTSGELFDYYRSLYREVLMDGQPRGHDFHCCSPDLERLLRMQVYRLRHARALFVSCSVRREQPHDIPTAEPVQALYRNHHGMVVMCGNCRRTRRAAVEPETWDWVPDFVRRQPARVSHGICNLCYEYYYPNEK